LDFSEEAVQAALARMGCGEGLQGVSGLVILSTCNRVEVYAAAGEMAYGQLESFLCEARGVNAEELRPHLYRYSDSDAIAHLMKVAAGLDSLVIGEPQILGQVTRALELARAQDASGPLLNRLFQAAIHAGKRAHTETGISRNPASVSSLASRLCEQAHPDLKSAQVVVLGAGEMAELAVEALRKRGAQKILVVNRTLERARSLAERWQAEVATFESIQSALARADILITSTGAPHTLIHPDMVATAMQARPERALVLIDIAVPRDIDPEVADVPRVRLVDIDSLNQRLETSLAERSADIPLVEAIIREEQADFLEFLSSLSVLPLIATLRQQAEAIRQRELERTLQRMPGLSEAERQHIELMTQALVKKILESPTRRLRLEASSGNGVEYAALTRALFGLDQQLGTEPTMGASAASPAD
jgi:glutamyl-tRNA reductase